MYHLAARAFRRELHALFLNPDGAREEFLRAVPYGGIEYARDALRSSPYHFGRVRPELVPERDVHRKGKYPTADKTAKASYGYVGKLSQFHREMVRQRDIVEPLSESMDEPLHWPDWLSA